MTGIWGTIALMTVGALIGLMAVVAFKFGVALYVAWLFFHRGR